MKHHHLYTFIHLILHLKSTSRPFLEPPEPPDFTLSPWLPRYPSRYEQVLSALCESMEALDEPEAKASMIWILGEYATWMSQMWWKIWWHAGNRKGCLKVSFGAMDWFKGNFTGNHRDFPIKSWGFPVKIVNSIH